MENNDTLPEITLQLFQGCFEVHTKNRGVLSVLLSIQDYLKDTTNINTGPVKSLKVSVVRLVKKGSLGSVSFTWNPNLSNLREIETHNIGSLRIGCKTVPGNYNLSIFYFFESGKIKVSGKTIDPQTASTYGEGMTQDGTESSTDIGLQTYFDNIMDLTAQALGTLSTTEHFQIGMMNAGFNAGYLRGVQEMAMKASSYPDWFVRAEGQEPEINGRKFAVKLFISDKLRVSFDHFGKVQVFCAKSFSDVLKCRDIFFKYLEECKRIGIVTTGS